MQWCASCTRTAGFSSSFVWQNKFNSLKGIKVYWPITEDQVVLFVRSTAFLTQFYQRIQFTSGENVYPPLLLSEIKTPANANDAEKQLLWIPPASQKRKKKQPVWAHEGRGEWDNSKNPSLSSNRETERSDGPTTLATFLILARGVHRVHAAGSAGSRFPDWRLIANSSVAAKFQLRAHYRRVKCHSTAAYRDVHPGGEKFEFLKKCPPYWGCNKTPAWPNTQSVHAVLQVNAAG